VELPVRQRRGLLALLDSVFHLPSQHGNVDVKIVAALERLGQAFRVLLRERAQEYGLSPIGAQFLVYLLHHDVELRRVSQLAREFRLTQATVSDAVASLEAKGLVGRELWPEDGRVMTLRLSTRGELVATELSSWADTIEEHLDLYSSEEKVVVMRFLMRLIGSLQASGVITVARMCVTCRFFQRDAHRGTGSPHHCRLLDVALGGPDLRFDCPEYEHATD
jgi:DNA-binding MarR family transcriptional regulator